MPDFQELLPADGSLDLNEVIYDKVLGSLGGTLNEIDPADFSQDTSLESLTLTLNGVDEAITLVQGQTAYSVDTSDSNIGKYISSRNRFALGRGCERSY